MIQAPRFLLPFESSGVPQIFCDVLVVGSGVAGQSGALEAARAGARVIVLTKDDRLESNTYYAQAGIAAALDPADSLEGHVADTLEAGAGLCHEDVVRAVVEAGPGAVKWLETEGLDFDRTVSGGEILLGREGGHSAHRVAHASGDATGREMQRALGSSVDAVPGLRLVPDAFVVDLLDADGRCVGALVHYRGELRIVWASAVLLASGGAAQLFRESTNPAVTTGDGIAMAYRAGARLRDMEFMQFHPTVLYVPGASRQLLSEAARGEGAVILDERGERFLPGYDERAELAPRDVVCRGIVTHMLERGDTHVLLDLRGLDPDRLRARLPGVLATARSVGIDPLSEPIPVRPAAHYTIGGVECDLDGRSSLPGLFVAGEVASSGLHGANRLASNSLLEGVVFGRRAGVAAAAEALARGRAEALELRVEGPGPLSQDVDAADFVRSVKSLVWRQAGVRREGGKLAAALAELSRWMPLVLQRTLPEPSGLEAQNLCILAGLLVEAALRRNESRGVHWRSDRPERDDERFLGHLVQERGSDPRFEPRPGASSEAAA